MSTSCSNLLVRFQREVECKAITYRVRFQKENSDVNLLHVGFVSRRGSRMLTSRNNLFFPLFSSIHRYHAFQPHASRIPILEQFGIGVPLALRMSWQQGARMVFLCGVLVRSIILLIVGFGCWKESRKFHIKANMNTTCTRWTISACDRLILTDNLDAMFNLRSSSVFGVKVAVSRCSHFLRQLA